MILDHPVLVLPQNPSIAIDIALLSCSCTVTTVFAGELVELESLLVLNVNSGKVEAEQCKAVILDQILSYRKLELAKLSCQAGGRRLSLRDACTTHGVKSGCDSSENGFPERKWWQRTRPSFCFWFHILLLYGSYPQRSPVWILREGETPVPGRSSTSSAGDHHTHDDDTSEAFSLRDRSPSKQKNQEKAKNSYSLGQ